jgi:hypothetical protein
VADTGESSVGGGLTGIFTYLKLDRIRRRTAARAPLAPVLQFIAHVRQGLLTRGPRYLHSADYRTGMTNEPGAVSHSAESARCFHGSSLSVRQSLLLAPKAHDPSSSSFGSMCTRSSRSCPNSLQLISKTALRWLKWKLSKVTLLISSLKSNSANSNMMSPSVSS